MALVVGFCLLLLQRDPRSFWVDDYQVQHLGAYYDMFRAWGEGELPLLSPYTWYGGALGGEYLFGTFSIFHNLALLVWKLNFSLPATGAAFSLIHMAVLAAGAFFLARQKGLADDLAIMVSLVVSLNGWHIAWSATAWIPSLTAFAWVPWAWWGLERALEKERGAVRFLPAGFFIYLNITGSWPFPVVMTGVVTAFLGLRTLSETRRIWDVWPLVAAWIFGAALAAPAILMLAEYYLNSARSGDSGLQWQWIMPPSAILGLVFPYYSTDWWGWGDKAYPRPAIELACGFLPPILLGAGMLRLRRKFVHAFRWDLGFLVVIYVLSIIPSVSPLRYSYRWIPLLHVVLALLAAHALASLRADDAARAADPDAKPHRFDSFTIVSGALGFVFLETIVILSLYSLFVHFDLGYQGILILLALPVLYFAWVGFHKIAASMEDLKRWLPCLVVLLSLWATYSHVQWRWVNRWDFPEEMRQAEPLDQDVLYFAFYSREEAYKADPDLALLVRQGNMPMLAGVRMVNGYSPVHPAGFARVLGIDSQVGFYSRDTSALRLLEREAGPDGLLELMGVDGLVLAESYREHSDALLEQGWEEVFSSDAGVVLHRIARREQFARSIPFVEIVASPEEIPRRIRERKTSAAPRLLVRPDAPAGVVDYSPVRLEATEVSRHRLEARVEALSAESPALILFERPWYPGYRATLDGRKLEVEAFNLIQLAVELPAGAEGLLVLEYSPATLRFGLTISLLALLTGGIVVASTWRQRRTVGDERR